MNEITIKKEELQFLFDLFYSQNKNVIDTYNWYGEKLRMLEENNKINTPKIE